MVKNKLRVLFFVLLGAGAAAALSAALYHIFGTNCITKALFGLPCPTCGMTRAALSLLSLDFAGAYFWHPFVFALPPFALAFCLVRKNGRPVVAAAAIVLLLAIFVIRLFVSGGTPPLDIFRDAPLFKLISFLF